METHSPLADQFAGLRAAPTADNGSIMLPAALHALIAAIFARIFARLEDLLRLWQSGQLPPPKTHPVSSRTPRQTPRRKQRTTNGTENHLSTNHVDKRPFKNLKPSRYAASPQIDQKLTNALNPNNHKALPR